MDNLINRTGRYNVPKPPRVPVLVSVNMHEVLKVYAASQGIRIQDAVEYLIEKSLKEEYKKFREDL